MPEEITATLESLEIDEETAEEKVEEAEEVEPIAEEMVMPSQILAQAAKDSGKSQLRFAEDIMPARRGRSSTKSDKPKKKRKGSYVKDTSEDGVKARKGQKDYTVEEDEEYF